MGFEPKPAPAGDINQDLRSHLPLTGGHQALTTLPTCALCHVEEWLKFDALWLRAAATSETWFMSPAGAGLGSNPIRDYIFLATSEADPIID